MTKHHGYKTDKHSLYNYSYRELICYWVVQCNRELCKTNDYLVSLTITVKEEVSCLDTTTMA